MRKIKLLLLLFQLYMHICSQTNQSTLIIYKKKSLNKKNNHEIILLLYINTNKKTKLCGLNLTNQN